MSIRPIQETLARLQDRVHKVAAGDLITIIRDGLGAVPLLMGSAS